MMRKPTLRDALDASLRRLLRGESISQCLYHYPTYEHQLRPLLEAALVLHRSPKPQPRQEAVQEGYDRMMAAVAAKRRRQAAKPQTAKGGLFSALGAGRPPRWLVMSGVAVIVLLLIGFAWVWQAGDLTSVLFEPTQAVISEAEGLVLRLPAGSRTWQSVMVGDGVAAGDRLQTMAEARAVVAVDADDEMTLLGGAEVLFLELPTRWRPEISPGVRQFQGVVRYHVGMDDALSQAPGLVGGVLFGVEPVAAAPIADDALVDQDGTRHFDVHSAVLFVRAEHARFVMTVAADGTTSVVVEAGQIVIMEDERVLTVAAGQVAYRAAGDDQSVQIGEIDLDAFLRQLQSRPDIGESTAVPTPTEAEPEDPTAIPFVPEERPTPAPENVDDGPAEVPKVPLDPGEDFNPPEPGNNPPNPDTDNEPPDEGGDRIRPIPPGQEGRENPNNPPGLDDREGAPPGHDNGGPPGQDKQDTTSSNDVTDSAGGDDTGVPSNPPPVSQPPGQGGNGNGNGNGNGKGK